MFSETNVRRCAYQNYFLRAKKKGIIWDSKASSYLEIKKSKKASIFWEALTALQPDIRQKQLEDCFLETFIFIWKNALLFESPLLPPSSVLRLIEESFIGVSRKRKKLKKRKFGSLFKKANFPLQERLVKAGNVWHPDLSIDLCFCSVVAVKKDTC